jgi:glycine cleavage system aminomethyltransferase T
VDLDKSRFVGQQELKKIAKQGGDRRQIVGLELEWTAIERAYDAVRLPPTMPAAASRVAVPVYKNGNQIGRATSTTWSPTLKKLIALATVKRDFAKPGTKLDFEITVEAVRHRVPATVVKTPFFNPRRKTAAMD